MPTDKDFSNIAAFIGVGVSLYALFSGLGFWILNRIVGTVEKLYDKISKLEDKVNDLEKELSNLEGKCEERHKTGRKTKK